MFGEYIQVNGLQIRIKVEEQKTKPVLLMTNAWPQTILCWQSTWRQLAERFSLVAYDMPGFGLSQGSPEISGPQAQAQFMLKLADQLKIDTFYAIGPDVGAPAILRLGQISPRIQGAVIFAGPGFQNPHFALPLKAMAGFQFLRNFWKTRGRKFTDLAMQSGYKKYRPTPEAAEEYRTANENPEHFAHSLGYIASYKRDLPAIGESLAKIQMPVLIAWGKQDAFVKVKNAYEINARIPNASLRVFEDSGHFLQEDAGSDFVDAVFEWYDGLNRTQ